MNLKLQWKFGPPRWLMHLQAFWHPKFFKVSAPPNHFYIGFPGGFEAPKNKMQTSTHQKGQIAQKDQNGPKPIRLAHYSLFWPILAARNKKPGKMLQMTFFGGVPKGLRPQNQTRPKICNPRPTRGHSRSYGPK